MTAGIKVGYNNSKFWFDEGDRNEFDAGTRAGLLAGLFTPFEVTPRFAFQPEFLYSRKGSTLRDADDEIEAEVD